jgi:hypothetical protein
MNMICKFLCPPPVKMVHYLESAPRILVLFKTRRSSWALVMTWMLQLEASLQRVVEQNTFWTKLPTSEALLGLDWQSCCLQRWLRLDLEQVLDHEAAALSIMGLCRHLFRRRTYNVFASKLQALPNTFRWENRAWRLEDQRRSRWSWMPQGLIGRRWLLGGSSHLVSGL